VQRVRLQFGANDYLFGQRHFQTPNPPNGMAAGHLRTTTIVDLTSRETFETALEHVSRDVPVFTATVRAKDARESMVGRQYDTASHIVVCEGETFRGIVRIEQLLAAPGDALLSSLMDPDTPYATASVDQEVAAWHAVRNRESALAVVDERHRFVGIMPPHRLMAVLLSEHEEDLSRLVGLVEKTSAARMSSEEPIRRRFRHRIPWLLVGLGGALLSADVVGWFELQLQETIALAFFIPAIVYLADAVGTQTETIVVRGLSVGVPLKTMVGRELLAGLMIGAVLAVIAGPVILWRWKMPTVALAVALALAAACSVAALVALMLPFAFTRLGKDPAFGSGPLGTVIQDLLSILIYLAIAMLLVG